MMIINNIFINQISKNKHYVEKEIYYGCCTLRRHES